MTTTINRQSSQARASDPKSRSRHAGPWMGQAAIVVFLLLFAVYLLTFSGRLHSIDEHSMLAVTESLAKTGGVRTDQNLWHVDFAFPSDTFGVDGHFYSKKGPATSLVALPFYWLGIRLGGVAPGHAAILSTLVVSALTGAALVLLVGRLGFGTGRGVLVALAWGLTTMAWPYARYFFSEPTAALFLVLAWLWLVPDQRVAERRLPGPGSLALSGLALGIAATTRVPYLAALPVFGLYLVGQRMPLAPPDLRRAPWRAGLVWAVGIAVPLVAYGLYNLARFGNPLSAGFVPEERFSLPVWEGALGMLASPGRSVFLFSPAVLLGVGLWWRFFQLRRSEALVVGALGIGHLLLYGGWYMWWGGLAWGPRFLVPLLPFALVPLTVLPRSPGWRGATVLLLGAGVVVNAAAVLASFTDTTEASASFSPANWSLRQNSLVQQFQLVRPGAFDIAWWHGGQPDLVAIALALVVAAGGLALLFGYRRRTLSPAVGAIAIVLALVLGWASIARYNDPPAASGNLRAALDAMRALPADTGLILGTPQRADWLALYAPLPRPAIVVAKNSVDRDPRVARTLAAAVAEHPRTAFAIEYTASGDPTSLAEAELDSQAFKVNTRWFADEIRLVTYLRPSVERSLNGEAALRLGDGISLSPYSIDVIGGGRVQADALAVRPGDLVAVRLVWRVLGSQGQEQPIRTDLTRFAHIERTAAGAVLAQNDRPPVDGLRPTSSWRVGEPIVDRFVIPIPPDAQPGEPFDLVVGLYDPQTGIRLPVVPMEGTTSVRHSADAIILATVRVEQP